VRRNIEKRGWRTVLRANTDCARASVAVDTVHGNGAHHHFLVVYNQPRRHGDLDLLLLVASPTLAFATSRVSDATPLNLLSRPMSTRTFVTRFDGYA
jgi:hypothetical protein